MLDALTRFRSLLIHFFRETEHGYTGNVVTADLPCIGLELAICEVHITQCLENARKINVAFAHRKMLVDGDVCFAAAVEPGRIGNIASVECLIERIGKEHMGELLSGIAQHGADIALALIVEEAMRGRVDIAEIL